MVEVFAGRDPRQQTDGSNTAINDDHSDMCVRYRLPRTACVLRPDMGAAENSQSFVMRLRNACPAGSRTMHEEAGRLHVQLLADVLSDLEQLCTALAAMARLGLMTVRNTWRFWPQRLVSCALATRFGGAWASSSSLIAARSIETISSNSRRSSPTSASLALPKRTRR